MTEKIILVCPGEIIIPSPLYDTEKSDPCPFMPISISSFSKILLAIQSGWI